MYVVNLIPMHTGNELKEWKMRNEYSFRPIQIILWVSNFVGPLRTTSTTINLKGKNDLNNETFSAGQIHGKRVKALGLISSGYLFLFFVCQLRAQHWRRSEGCANIIQYLYTIDINAYLSATMKYVNVIMINYDCEPVTLFRVRGNTQLGGTVSNWWIFKEVVSSST